MEWKYQVFQGLSGTVSELIPGNPKHSGILPVFFGAYEQQENSDVLPKLKDLNSISGCFNHCWGYSLNRPL